jgi:hypothetical protein
MFSVCGFDIVAGSGLEAVLISGTASSTGMTAGIGLCLAASMLACCYNGPPRGVRGTQFRGRMPRILLVPLVVCLIVYASRGVHSTITIDPNDAEDGFSTSATTVERADSNFEHRIDRLGDHIDRSVDHTAWQLERHIERLVARIESHFNHLTAEKPHKPVRPGVPVVVMRMREEPDVIEPNAPALPVTGAIPADAPSETSVATVPDKTNPSTAPTAGANPAPTVSTSTVVSVPPATAASTAPSSTVSAPVAAAAATATETAVESEKLPDWTKTEIVDEEHRKLVVVSGGLGGSQKEAEQNALEAARRVLGAEISRSYPRVRSWLPSTDAVQTDAVRLSFVEKVHRKTQSSGVPFIVYRAYNQIELSPAVYAQLISNWKEEVVPWRLELLGSCAALLTLTFATSAAYFRLNERTRGQYRGRLGLAAATVIAAGGAFAAAAVFG